MSDVMAAPKSSRSRRNDWDGAWKEAIQQLFPAFLELLFPAVHAIIDWSQEPVFLEQELRQVTRRAKRGKGVVDKLVRVLQLNGSHTTLLIHIDFQNQVDLDLPVRLYTYNISIFALLKEPAITLAVLGDQIRNGGRQNFNMHWRALKAGCVFPLPSFSIIRRSGRHWSRAPTPLR